MLNFELITPINGELTDAGDPRRSESDSCLQSHTRFIKILKCRFRLLKEHLVMIIIIRH